MPLVKTPYDDLTYNVIGAAMDVHNALGPGHKESVYQKALSTRLAEKGISFVAEQGIEIYYAEQPVGLLFVDHLVEDVLVVEAKAFAHMLTDEETAQVITYLAALGKPVGLLLNFGRKRLEHKRIFAPTTVDAWHDRIQRYLWQPMPDQTRPGAGRD